MKKMIVLDLDGTLLNAFQKVSKKSIDYLQNLKEQGYIITIATGRILASVLNVTNNSSFANYIISDTGATCFDRQNNNVCIRKLSFSRNHRGSSFSIQQKV